MKQALFFQASATWILRLWALALLSFLFLDFEDFAVDIIGKGEENFVTTLSISLTKIINVLLNSCSYKVKSICIEFVMAR